MYAMHCPQCGSDDLGERAIVYGTALGGWVYDAQRDAVTFQPSGRTEIDWDSQEAFNDEPAVCNDCGWVGWGDDLDHPPDTPEEEAAPSDNPIQSPTIVFGQTVETRL